MTPVMEPEWILRDVVLNIHRENIADTGGLDGLRDSGMLESALSRPQNQFYYAEQPPRLTALAAGYAYGIVKNHPFADANKRTALAICRGFLELNGALITVPDEEMFAAMIRLAADETTEDDFALWLDERTTGA